MLQRIQTVYLTIALILLALVNFFPTANILSEGSVIYQLTFKGMQPVVDTAPLLDDTAIPLSILSVIMPIITLVTICLYKRRMLQIRLSVFNAVLMLGYYGLYAYKLSSFYFLAHIESVSQQLSVKTEAVSLVDYEVLWPVIFPLIAVILTVLAIIAIYRDNLLVKSLNRIRE